jgi:hypothetical protein
MGSGDWGCSETAGKCSDTVVRQGTILDGSLAFLPHTVKSFFVFFFVSFSSLNSQFWIWGCSKKFSNTLTRRVSRLGRWVRILTWGSSSISSIQDITRQCIDM